MMMGGDGGFVGWTRTCSCNCALCAFLVVAQLLAPWVLLLIAPFFSKEKFFFFRSSGLENVVFKFVKVVLIDFGELYLG